MSLAGRTWWHELLRRLQAPGGRGRKLEVDHLLRYPTKKLVSSLQFFGSGSVRPLEADGRDESPG